MSTNDEFLWASSFWTPKSGFEICLRQLCEQTNGAVVNTGSSTCGCGSTVCDGTTGMFCFASQNRCAVGPPCSNSMGLSINTNDCVCGSSDCNSTTGRFCLASGNKCAATKIADKFQVTAGSCTTSESCFQSPNYPSNYDMDGTCTIKVLRSDGVNEKLFV